ncbi:MAG: hypothetical protein M9894_32125 [Planctomycetes bacterium]|nr:hypothetical protein [Planctomycetota bacterium]
MLAARHALRVAALAALALAAPARAQDPAWLRSTQLERHEPDVVAWRHEEGWARGLARVALDPRRPLRDRERAVALLGSTGDDPVALQTLVDLQHDDPRLAVHVQQALRRVWARRRAVEALAGVTTPALAAQVAAALDADVRDAAIDLARDPLFPGAASAVRVVGALPTDPSVDEVLVAAARDGRPDARQAALEALAARGRAQAVAEASPARCARRRLRGRGAAPGGGRRRRAAPEPRGGRGALPAGLRPRRARGRRPSPRGGSPAPPRRARRTSARPPG